MNRPESGSNTADPRVLPTMPATPKETTTLRIDAAGLADARRSIRGPVSVWVEKTGAGAACGPGGHTISARIVHIGPLDGPGAPRSDDVIDRTGAVLIPGLVNAHTHLDLTAIGPRPHDPSDGFVPWVNMVRTHRPVEADAIHGAVRLGAERSLAGGVVAVGDILGAAHGQPTTAGLAALAESHLRGVGFVEFFGIGTRREQALARLTTLARELAAWPAGARIRPGLQPHAPNTVSLPVYRAASAFAARDGFPISTHLAETPEEREFIANASGPQRDLLDSLGFWDDTELEWIGSGAHPVAHLADVLAQTPMLAAHLNDATDDAIDTLARTGTSVVYCPRASAYFGAPDRLGAHRFQEMLDSGVNVCLGTDSIINLGTADRISPLDDARLLARTTGTSARTLLAMMTTHGAAALGLDPDGYLLENGHEIAGIVAVPVGSAAPGDRGDPAAAVLANQTPPELL